MATLPPGSRVGAYEVVGTIGAGGMGQVLRARDVALRRDVALKILPANVAGDEDSRSRLEREARVLASLNHPHIAQVYGLEQSAAGPAIAMEFVEGLTLREHVQKGVSRGDALRLAHQVAMALDAAHEKGIVHRDLKPGNVMVTPEGVAKVLDFGLARSGTGAAPTADHDTTLAATVEGAIVGTPAYMSPEQARGHAVDRRTDIWAFGCILYELLAGRPPFAGETTSDLTAAILQRDPDWRALPADTPPHLRRLLERCLQKDRRARLRDIGDALHEITSPGSADAVPTSGAPVGHGRTLQFAIVALVALALGGFVMWLMTRGGESIASAPAMVRLELPAPAGLRFGAGIFEIEVTTIAISPDGSTLAFIASRAGEAPRIWVRPLSDANAREITGTDNAISVFFSPDGQRLGFFAAGQLKSVGVAGGAPLKICDVPLGVGLSGSWGRQGDILFATVQGERISRVPAGGGTPTDAIVGSQETGRALWPRHLPDGRGYIYSDVRAGTPGHIVLVDGDGQRTTLLEATSQAQWVDPHWLLFVREGTLLAQRVDLSARRTVGEPIAVLGSVAYSAATGWSNVAASPTGTIVARWHVNEQRLTWFDARGVERTAVSRPAGHLGVRLAPDDGALLFERLRPELGNFDIWRIDLARGSEEPITNTPDMEAGQAWVPGGRGVVYSAARRGPPNVHYRDLATGVERRLTTSTFLQISDDVSPDGTVIFQQRTQAGTFDLMSISINGPQDPKPVITSAASEGGARLQPGGKLMSYSSDQSGRLEIYLSAFPPAGPRIPVSTSGGFAARWRRDGRELFFLSQERRLMAVPIDASGKPGEARVLFDARNWVDYDVARDGRFIAIVSQKVGAEQPLAVIVNWRQ
jgi:Tol biopolymer transport system component/predicted Ser/Thr protein kinase